MDEIIGRGPQYGHLFWWGCHVGEHSAWAPRDGTGRQGGPRGGPVLRGRAVVRRVSRRGGPELRDWHEAREDADA